MDEAPRGQTITSRFTHHHSGKDVTKDLVLQAPIILSVGDEVIKSFWSTKREHWSGISDTETPTAWMAWPEAYNE